MASAPENETRISAQLGAEHRRHSRIPFTASVEVIESKSGARLSGRISDLGLGGCYMDTLSSFPAGSEVLVRITNGEDLFEAQARVVYDQTGMGMGLAFVSFTPKSAQVLQKWLLEITSKAPAAEKTSELRKNIDGMPKNNVLSTPATKLDKGQQDMQQIPVVENTRWSAPVGRSTGNPGRAAQIGGAVAVVLLAGAAIAWWGLRMRTKAVEPSSSQTVPAVPSVPPTPIDPPATVTATDGPSQVGTTEELTKVWAAKEFTFIKPITNQTVKGMVIRLPNRDLWAFALQEPHGQCDLEFVTDLNRLAKQYGYQSNHPMVASPCSGTVYDPLKLDTIGENTWARGAVVQGGGVRPPISINVQVRGQSVIANQIE
jgi:hypothetical protein